MQEISLESIFEVSDNGYGGITLNMWFDIWLEVYKRDRIKQTTIDTYKALYDRHLRYSIGSHDMREFKPLHIRKLYNDFLKTGYSAKYLNTLHTMLNNMFKTAVSNEIVNTNPCSDIERPVCKSHERRVLSVDEQKRLCTQIKQPGFEDLVFCGKKGQPQWRTSVVSAIDTVVRSINEDDRDEPHMERILPHAFRHTFATRCLEAGIPPKVVQKWLGHASINMTLDLYTHVSEDLSAQHMYTLEKCMGWGEDK
ncbi:MAG: tyrosine-type recombinase/integrase family protein [Eubacterium sp.]|nr:tyrosine-type recombinase/integrase family protein [Eubacterium sp.]